jgi:hypothetical protein
MCTSLRRRKSRCRCGEFLELHHRAIGKVGNIFETRSTKSEEINKQWQEPDD